MDFVPPPVFRTDTSSGFRITILVAIHIIFAFWLKYIVGRLPLGGLRVLAVLPVLIVQTATPWFFDKDKEPLQVFCTIFIVTWQGTFKVLAFCWGRAPLRESMTVAQITASLALPLFPKPLSRSKSRPEGRMQDSAGSGTVLAIRLMGKTALLVVVVLLYENYRETMPVVIKHYLLAFIVYSMSGIIMDGPAALVVESLGLEVLPTFDQPWMSASLREFWGQRWNIPTTSVLRSVVYDTCAEGSLISPERLPLTVPKTATAEPAATTATTTATAANRTAHTTPTAGSKAPISLTASGSRSENGYGTASPPPAHPQPQPQRPSLLRQQQGLNAAFFISGVFHEYMAWLLTGSSKLGWKWTVFFWVQAPLMTVEAYGSRALRRAGVRLPRPLTIILTHVVLQGLALDLFFGHMEEQGISQKIVGAIAKCIHAVLRPLLSVALSWLETGHL